MAASARHSQVSQCKNPPRVTACVRRQGLQCSGAPPHSAAMSPVLRRILYAAAAFAAAFGILWLADREFFKKRGGNTEPDTFTAEERPRFDPGQTSLLTALSEERALVVERVTPGVVSIQVERRRAVTEDGPLKPDGTAGTVERFDTEPGVGSGAIVSKEGHVITNWHVVDGGTERIFVTLSGEAGARRATLVDKDDQIDLALLKVEPRRPGEVFTALRFGDSDKMKVGHEVLAVGSPFNLRGTVTDGIISYRDRRVSDTLTSYFQIDCTINPGNSGGPLVNLQGDIIGLVTRKLQGPEEATAAEGYGLAIPGNDVLETVDRLRSKGRPRIYHGLAVDDWPRVSGQPEKPSEAVVITGINGRSPAEKAGLRQGDVIESVNGVRVSGFSDWRRALREHKVGDTLTLSVRREGEMKELSVVLEDFDKAVPPDAGAKPVIVRGVTVRPLRRFERNMLGLAEPIGLEVEKVAGDSPFAAILSPKMKITRVATPDRVATNVATPAEFEEALKALAATGGFLMLDAFGVKDDWVKFEPLP